MSAAANRDEAPANVPAPAPSWHRSSTLEKVLEYRFLAGVCAELLGRGADFEVLRSDVDNFGHDLIIEACGISRHIQLKGMVSGGKRAEVSINSRLALKPSGCVVWMIYDPRTFELEAFRWFGGAPGEMIPPLGEIVARHSKGTSEGIKSARPLHRVVRRSQFHTITGFPSLVDRLFGSPLWPAKEILLEHLASGQIPDAHLPIWLMDVRNGRFDSVPKFLTFADSVHLAHLVDGYALAGTLGILDPHDFAEKQLVKATATGVWEGHCAALWLTLFLEHRRWRQASPHEPDSKVTKLLDQLAMQLAASLRTPTD